tara:strand:+ start:178 stop:324 length:147 start_codon:yes stop_codon:yes gene_type:complete
MERSSWSKLKKRICRTFGESGGEAMDVEIKLLFKKLESREAGRAGITR